MPEKVTFTAERETALLTLFGKARQSASADPILPDSWAEEAIRFTAMRRANRILVYRF